MVYLKGIEGAEKAVRIDLDNDRIARELFGAHGDNLAVLKERLDVEIHTRGSSITIAGDDSDVELTVNLLRQMEAILKKGHPLYPTDFEYALRILAENRNAKLEQIFLDTVFISARNKIIAPKSLAQKEYIDAIRRYDIVVAIGPAGTGKTYLAMAMAVASLLKKEYSRIILARPAVEAGEKLGFLPGDLYEKVNPYLRPLYDALHDMMDYEKARALIQRGEVEVAPLAFMRGRTLNDSFVILDEAQNTTSEQMKMFLTRLGFGSKAVITGDITQIDLMPGKTSGLIEISKILKDIEGIKFTYFTEKDVVRHRLIQEIIKAYERESNGYGTDKH